MPNHLRDRTKAAVWLCAGMLIVCLLALMYVLRDSGLPEPEGAAFGMVLIDIADEKTADSYHVRDCGVYVLAVQEESPAGLAGISSGDLLLSVNGAPVQNTGEFVDLQEMFEPGELVRMQFQRGHSGDGYAVTLAWNESRKSEARK